MHETLDTQLSEIGRYAGDHSRIEPPAALRARGARRARRRRGGAALLGATAVAAVAVTIGVTHTGATTGGTPAAIATPGGTASGSPAYSVAKNADGTITLDVYRESGYAAANARLRQIGDKQVVVVPIRPGCPSIGSLPRPATAATGDFTVNFESPGSATVSATGIPAGDTMVVGLDIMGDSTVGVGTLTSGSAPSCVSVSAVPGSAGSGGV